MAFFNKSHFETTQNVVIICRHRLNCRKMRLENLSFSTLHLEPMLTVDISGGLSFIAVVYRFSCHGLRWRKMCLLPKPAFCNDSKYGIIKETTVWVNANCDLQFTMADPDLFIRWGPKYFPPHSGPKYFLSEIRHWFICTTSGPIVHNNKWQELWKKP